MTIKIGDVWQPSRGVSQVNITLGTGRPPAMPPEKVRAIFIALPEVIGLGAAGRMWGQGMFDLSLDPKIKTMSPALRDKLTAACEQVIAAG